MLRRLVPLVLLAALALRAGAKPPLDAVAPVPAPQAQPAPAGDVQPGLPPPAPAAGRHPADAATVEAVTAFLRAWLRDWIAQDAAAYFAHYAADAVVDDRARADFEAHKRGLFARGGTIDVKVGDLRVETDATTGEPLIRARFDQEYSSSRLTDFGRKELVVRREGDRLLIVRESWTPVVGHIERPLGEPAEAAPAAVSPPAPADVVAPAPSTPPSAAAGPAPSATTAHAPSAAPPPGDADAPLLGEGYVPPASSAAPASGEPQDVLDMSPLLGPAPPTSGRDYGLPADSGDRRVVEEIVATVNGQILTRTMLQRRIAWYESSLVERDPADLEEQLAHLGQSALDATIDRWVILQEARQHSADVEGFWREWLAQFRRQVQADNLEDLEKLLKEQGSSLEELKEQVSETEVPNVFLQQQVGSTLTFTEEELRSWFDSHHAEFQDAQEVTLRQILIPVPAGASPARAISVADAAIASLRDGKDWCQVHDVYGGGEPGCGEVGTLRVSDMAPELREAAVGLPVGAVSRPVVSTQGVHVLQVTERRGLDPVTFEQARETVLSSMREEVYQQKTREYVDDLRRRAVIEINPKYQSGAEAAAPSGGVSQ